MFFAIQIVFKVTWLTFGQTPLNFDDASIIFRGMHMVGGTVFYKHIF